MNGQIWSERYEDINALERHLSRSGTLVLKFFLHLSKEGQRQRFLERIETPSKNWKFSMQDIAKRQRWGDYMDAYDEMIRHTATRKSPWHILPADHKWVTRIAVAGTIVHALDRLRLNFPQLNEEARKQLNEARKALR